MIARITQFFTIEFLQSFLHWKCDSWTRVDDSKVRIVDLTSRTLEFSLFVSCVVHEMFDPNKTQMQMHIMTKEVM